MPPLYTQHISHEINKFLLHRQVIGDYYHMTTMDENVKWMKLAHLLSFFLSTLGPPFARLLHLYFKIVNNHFKCTQ